MSLKANQFQSLCKLGKNADKQFASQFTKIQQGLSECLINYINQTV